MSFFYTEKKKKGTYSKINATFTTSTIRITVAKATEKYYKRRFKLTFMLAS